jgi:hypothetical protein
MRPEIRRAVQKVRPFTVLQYAESRHWERVEGIAGRFWLMRHPEQRLRQLQIPMDDEDVGYVDAMQDVIERLADTEAIERDTVLENLLSSDSDVLRLRVIRPNSDGGQLPLIDDVALRESARRALLSTACSVIKPAAFHPRLSRTEADQFLAACRAGQTEVGSYVVKIICPLHAVDEIRDLLDPQTFTRRVTSHLMLATSGLVRSIEQSSVDTFIKQHEERPLLSANLCEALLNMQPDREPGQLELRATWGVDPRVVPPSESVVPPRVVIKAEYLPEIERAARILRPMPSVEQDEELIGTVEELRGAVGEDGRRSGEVYFSLLLPEGDSLRARANLDVNQYATAMRAHEQGRVYVRLVGVLRRGPRISEMVPLKSVQLLHDREKGKARIR